MSLLFLKPDKKAQFKAYYCFLRRNKLLSIKKFGTSYTYARLPSETHLTIKNLTSKSLSLTRSCCLKQLWLQR